MFRCSCFVTFSKKCQCCTAWQYKQLPSSDTMSVWQQLDVVTSLSQCTFCFSWSKTYRARVCVLSVFVYFVLRENKRNMIQNISCACYRFSAARKGFSMIVTSSRIVQPGRSVMVAWAKVVRVNCPGRLPGPPRGRNEFTQLKYALDAEQGQFNLCISFCIASSISIFSSSLCVRFNGWSSTSCFHGPDHYHRWSPST